MERTHLKNKNNFSQLFAKISQVYKESNTLDKEAYLNGKKEAYEEVLSWLQNNHNHEFKYINANAFFAMIQEKLTKARMQLNNNKNKEEDDKIINFTEFKFSENKKRVLRFINDDDLGLEDDDESSENGSNNNESSTNVYTYQNKKKKYK